MRPSPDVRRKVKVFNFVPTSPVSLNTSVKPSSIVSDDIVPTNTITNLPIAGDNQPQKKKTGTRIADRISNDIHFMFKNLSGTGRRKWQQELVS